MLVLGCAQAPAKVSIEVPCDDFTNQSHISKDVTVTAGGSLNVTLCSNPTTGFQWVENATISDQTVVNQTSHQFVAPEDQELVGAPGEEVWTFEALRKGKSTVSMEYSRPWEGGEKGEWTFTLNVTVN
jgi:inhibitor of cysteine peptidase